MLLEQFDVALTIEGDDAGEQEKWMWLLRFESEIGINSDIGVENEVFCKLCAYVWK